MQKTLESRKYQLQRQIIEALKSKDTDLYSLLKSQWAHRFGVESLEELKNIDLDQDNQNLTDSKNQKIDETDETLSYVEKEFHVEEDVNQEKEIRSSEFDSIRDNNDESFEAKPSQNVVKGEVYNKEKKSSNVSINHPRVEALIPLPPKPKYSYLKKWLLRK